MSGKGSRPRPFSVTQEEFGNRMDLIFGVKPSKERYVPPPLPEDMQNVKSSHETQLGKDLPAGRT
jgi:hypothetical protein